MSAESYLSLVQGCPHAILLRSPVQCLHCLLIKPELPQSKFKCWCGLLYFIVSNQANSFVKVFFNHIPVRTVPIAKDGTVGGQVASSLCTVHILQVPPTEQQIVAKRQSRKCSIVAPLAYCNTLPLPLAIGSEQHHCVILWYNFIFYTCLLARA